MQIEKNFNISEFKCKDGTEVPPEYIHNVTELCSHLQTLRDFINKPIIIISGYRSPNYNKSIGSRTTSQHLLGKAADIIVPGVTPLEIRDTIIKLIKEGRMKKGGVGLYDKFVHYDVRGFNTRWSSVTS
jgi:uncharacterized protein YcbK (DUF882 family)